MEKSNKDNDDVSDDIEIMQITPQTMTILFLSVIVVIVGGDIAKIILLAIHGSVFGGLHMSTESDSSEQAAPRS